MISMEESIERAAKWFDESHPGWHNRVDLDIFNMDYCSKCIIGQVCSSKSGLSVLSYNKNLSLIIPIFAILNITTGVFAYGRGQQKYWTNEILMRRANDVSKIKSQDELREVLVNQS
jgi:hypothetical protein